jgi:putative DNA primase/helicase
MSADLLTLGITCRPHGPAEQRVRCPRCGDGRGASDDALGVNIETGVFHCFRCGWSGKAATGETRAAPLHAQLDDPERADRVRQRLREVWKAAKPLDHRLAGPVRRYFQARGLERLLLVFARGEVLRAHPALPYWDNCGRREVGRFPALVAILTGPDNKPRAIHATYLRADGFSKAAVGSPKKILPVPTRGATRGGAIRLFAVRDGVLGVAEGLENAMALALLHKVPTWSAYCADNLAQVRLPPGLRELHIAVDVDENGKGEQVARTLAARAAREQPDLVTHLIIPAGAAPRDLNDELLAARRSAS